MAAESGTPGTPERVHSGDHAGQSNGGGTRDQDRFLPIANISRIMKKAIPANGKIAKHAKESVQECVSEFISFVTSEASNKCHRERRKTINGDELLWAIGTVGFEDYVEPLKLYLQMYREMEGDSKGSRATDQSGRKEGPIVLGDPSILVGQQVNFDLEMNYMHHQFNITTFDGPDAWRRQEQPFPPVRAMTGFRSCIHSFFA